MTTLLETAPENLMVNVIKHSRSSIRNHTKAAHKFPWCIDLAGLMDLKETEKTSKSQTQLYYQFTAAILWSGSHADKGHYTMIGRRQEKFFFCNDDFISEI